MCKGVVLVVDDNPGCLFGLSMLIRAMGYNTKEAASGEAAISLMESSFHAVVTDMNMGLDRLTGNDVARFAKQIRSDMNVIVVSASADYVPDTRNVNYCYGKPMKEAEVNDLRMALDTCVCL